MPLFRFWGGFALLFLSSLVAANTSVHFEGEAKVDERVSYLEHHVADYDSSGELLKTSISYTSPDGKKIANMVTDFKESLTVPTFSIENFRTGNIEGIRREGEKIILFDHDKGAPERTRTLTDDDSDDRTFMAGQGFNYYIVKNLDSMKSDSKVYLRFLIPGKLDYYDFNLSFEREINGIAEFEVTIQNWFLKLFAPKLYVRYDKAKKRIVWYKGVSNIADDKGNIQNVTITYKYDSQ